MHLSWSNIAFSIAEYHQSRSTCRIPIKAIGARRLPEWDVFLLPLVFFSPWELLFLCELYSSLCSFFLNMLESLNSFPLILLKFAILWWGLIFFHMGKHPLWTFEFGFGFVFCAFHFFGKVGHYVTLPGSTNAPRKIYTGILNGKIKCLQGPSIQKIT